MNTQTRIIELFQNELHNVELHFDSNNENTMGWDSQFQLVVIMIIEEEFDITIPNDRLNELTSIKNIVKLIKDLGQ